MATMDEQDPVANFADEELSVEELDEVAGGDTINGNCVSGCGGSVNTAAGCGTKIGATPGDTGGAQ